MRKWHRIIAPYFALFLIVITVTGVAVQATDLLDTPKEAATHVKAGKAPGPAALPEPRPAARKDESAMRRWGHWLKKLHSGESLGPIGLAINILSGLALLFFATSGLWMYVQIPLRRWQRQRARH